jgi:hypothetical protein
MVMKYKDLSSVEKLYGHEHSHKVPGSNGSRIEGRYF